MPGASAKWFSHAIDWGSAVPGTATLEELAPLLILSTSIATAVLLAETGTATLMTESATATLEEQP